MTLIYKSYLPLFLIGFGVLVFILFKRRRRFLRLVYDYWFLRSSWSSRLSFIFYLLSLGLLLFSLLDIRGAEEKIAAEIPDQKTIIMIDTSASMLAEDVRPNRFEKALWMARHFVKNAAGHQISVVLFSDIQKQIVPFTDDIDLLEARIEGLKSMRLNHGGSNISQALAEIATYFKGSNGTSSGNVLLFTDGEEGDNRYEIKNVKDITLAVVGIGTNKGARIPLRDRNQQFIGYKKYKGKEIVTRLNEKFFKQLGSSFKAYRYWIAQSYTIPTEEILSFFRKTFQKGHVKGEIVVRPVLGYGVIKLALASLIVGVVLGYFKNFVYVLLVITFLISTEKLSAQSAPTPNISAEQKKILEKLNREIAKYKKLLNQQRLDRGQRLQLANLYLQKKDAAKARAIYEENGVALNSSAPEVVYNYAVTLLLTKDIKQGVSLLHKLSQRYPDPKLQEAIAQTLLQILQQQQQQKKQNNKEKENKQKNKEQQKKQQQNSSKDQQKDKQQNKKEQNKQQQNKQDKKEQDKKEQNKQDENKQNKKEQNKQDKKEQQQDKQQKEQNKQKSKEQKQQPRSLKEKEEQIKKKRRMVRVPTILKKILNDDRKLQERYIDTKTDKREYKQQDW